MIAYQSDIESASLRYLACSILWYSKRSGCRPYSYLPGEVIKMGDKDLVVERVAICIR